MPSLPPYEPSDEDKEMLRQAQEQYERALRRQEAFERRNAINSGVEVGASEPRVLVSYFDENGNPQEQEVQLSLSGQSMIMREAANGDREASTDGGQTWLRLPDQQHIFMGGAVAGGKSAHLQSGGWLVPPNRVTIGLSSSATQPQPVLSRHVYRLLADGRVMESHDGGETFTESDPDDWKPSFKTSLSDDRRHTQVWRILNRTQQRLVRKAAGHVHDRISVGKLPEIGIRRQTQLLMEDVVWAADELVEHLETQKPTHWSPLDWLTRRGQRIGKVVETINTLRRFAASLEERPADE